MCYLIKEIMLHSIHISFYTFQASQEVNAAGKPATLTAV